MFILSISFLIYTKVFDKREVSKMQKKTNHRLGKMFFSLIILLISVGGLMYIYAKFIEPSMLKTTTYEVKIPKHVEECRVVFFSDTHFGELYLEENLDRIVDKINSLNPDIVIFGGDFFDDYSRDKHILDISGIADKLKRIDSTYGKYAVYGNHDYGGGASKVYNNIMSDGGFEILINSNALIENLNLRIIGFDDYLMGHTDPSLYSLKSETYNIVVCHEPDVADFITIKNPGIMLAGHSHGGQVSLPIITEKILPIGAQKYVKGMYENITQGENLTLYVSSGIGVTVFPYRFLNTPEVVLLDLKY